ncbi:MAG: hypothetical protein JSS50_05085 [Proteobacteria bacterium]|nr:hypothetical protein [Pseudomonadota bacterium]
MFCSIVECSIFNKQVWGVYGGRVSFAPIIIGSLILADGVQLAALEAPCALTPVGTSNLAMVLALSGAALALVSTTAWPLAHGYMKCKNKQNKHNVCPTLTALYLMLPAAFFAANYATIHWGVAQLFPSTWSASASLWAQAGIGAIFGVIAGFLYGLWYAGRRGKVNWTLWESASNKKCEIIVLTLGSGLLCSASTALGPALSAMMGDAANNLAENISLQIMVSLGAAVLFPILMRCAYHAQNLADEEVSDLILY